MRRASSDDPLHQRHKDYPRTGTARLRTSRLSVAQGRVRLSHRTERRRQEHVLKLIYMDERPTRGDVRVERHELGRRRQAARRREAPPEARHRLPGFPAARGPHGRAERRVRARGDRHAARGDPRQRCTRALDAGRASRRRRRAIPRELSRRRAAARRDRARARERSVRADRRRADRQPRRARDARRLPAAARHQRVGHRGASWRRTISSSSAARTIARSS